MKRISEFDPIPKYSERSIKRETPRTFKSVKDPKKTPDKIIKTHSLLRANFISSIVSSLLNNTSKFIQKDKKITSLQ